jgi:hypothetical protein
MLKTRAGNVREASDRIAGVAEAVVVHEVVGNTRISRRTSSPTSQLKQRLMIPFRYENK